MQTTTKTRFWKYLLPAVAAVLVVAVVPRSAPQPSYRRFTSPAFPDGVRYTLLYPSALDDGFILTPLGKPNGNLVQSFEAYRKESRLPGMAQWHRWFRPETEIVYVSVKKTADKPLRSSRVDTPGVQNRDEIRHTIEVDDPRASEHFTFGHVDYSGTALYTQHDRVVAGSFRVLPPGEAVPTPSR